MSVVTCPYCGREVRLVPYGYGRVGVCCCGSIYNGGPEDAGNWERYFAREATRASAPK
jgi:hypothetical protein